MGPHVILYHAKFRDHGSWFPHFLMQWVPAAMGKVHSLCLCATHAIGRNCNVLLISEQMINDRILQFRYMHTDSPEDQVFIERDRKQDPEWLIIIRTTK